MKNDYSFFKDELALMEIRKHKWIESEKQGCEIGFATSALDWIKKYGFQWQQSRLAPARTEDLLSEKRRYRRFYRQLPIQLNVDNKHIGGHTYDINLIGVSCSLAESVEPNTYANVTIRLPRRGSLFQKLFFRFPSRVLRIAEAKESDQQPFRYNIFLPFSEEIRNYLRANPDFLGNI